MPWWCYAILGAVFSGLVSVLVKPGYGSGLTQISPNLGTGIRMLMVFPLAWAVVWAEGSFGQMNRIVPKQWGFLLLSGVATGLAWLFYFVALSKADVNKVNPIDKSSLAISFVLAVMFLGETITWQKAVAAILVVAALFITLIK